MIEAKIVVVNSKDEIVGKIVSGASVEAVNAKIDKLADSGRLVRVEAWSE